MDAVSRADNEDSGFRVLKLLCRICDGVEFRLFSEYEFMGLGMNKGPYKKCVFCRKFDVYVEN